MNTKKVAELLAEIEKAQEAVKALEKEAAGVAKKIAAQNERVQSLKRALAEELAEVVGPAAPQAASAGRRRRGVTAAVLEALADGQPLPTDEISARLSANGMADVPLSVTLASLAKKGRLVRVSRGVYQLAPAAK